jgi:type I restriction enzyme S subunit
MRVPDCERIRVPAPPLPTQKKIGATLGVIDDLIENNRRRIEILEEMARLIYREWFVHFRFPGHENVELADSGLGPIPEDWTVEVTSDLITGGVLEIGDGYRAKNSEFAGTDFAFVRVKNVREGYLDLTDVDYCQATA